MELVHGTEALELSLPKELPQSQTFANAECISTYRLAAVLLVADLVILSLSGVVPVLSYGAIGTTARGQHLFVVGVAIPIFLLAAQALDIYDTKRILALKRSILRAILSILLTFAILMVVGVGAKTSEEYSRVWFFSWVVLSLISVVLTRTVLLACVEAKLANGACLQRALLVSCGNNPLSSDQLRYETRNRIRAVGTITVLDLTTMPDLHPYLRELRPELVVLSLPWSQIDIAIGRLKALTQHAVEVLVLPQANSGLEKALRLRRLGRQTLLQIAEPPLADRDRIMKRIEDVFLASIALLVTLPLLFLTALAIRLESKGPVLFKQVREGFNGDLIEVWKFRSMYLENTDSDASRQTSKDDPRVTRVGRFIRKTSIDELPQFWNVLQGQMSVVGPRPHALGTSAEGKALNAIVEEYAARHRVKPGITGWAQINGARGELCSRDQVKRRVDYDLYYIENWSIFLDIRIIITTAMRALRDPCAY